MGFPFYFADKEPKQDLNYEYDTHYPTQDPVLRFTKTDESGKALQRSTGRLLYNKTIPFDPTVNFNTTVKFTIKPNSLGSPIADGLAFFIVPENHTFPEGSKDPPGGNLGIFEQTGKSPKVFAVAFDTHLGVSNNVSFGIDIESRTPEPKAKKDVPYSFIGKELTLFVSYDSATKEISASVNDGSSNFPVSRLYNLTTILPNSVIVGLASTTGQNVSVHDVSYWDFTSTAPAPCPAPAPAPAP